MPHLAIFATVVQLAFIAAVVFTIVYIVVRIMNYLQLRTTVSQQQAEQTSPGRGVLEDRLAEIERRLTDVQDVMIALSEKFDRWEERSRRVDTPGRT